MFDSLQMFLLIFGSIFSPNLTSLQNSLSLQLPLLQCSNQLMVRGYSLVELRCRVILFFSPMFRLALRNSQLFRLPPLRPIISLDTDTLVLSPPNCSVFLVECFSPEDLYIYMWDLGIFLLFYLRTRACAVLVVSNWALYLAVESSFVGGVAVEVFRFSLSIAQLIAGRPTIDSTPLVEF